MRSRATWILLVATLAQIALVATALGVLVWRLRTIQADMVRLANEETALLRRFGDAQVDLLQVSNLVRDNIILDGAAQARAKQDLDKLLGELAQMRLDEGQAIPEELREPVAVVESARREYFAGARTVSEWEDVERKANGPRYLREVLGPTRDEFAQTVRQIQDLVATLRQSRNEETRGAMDELRGLILRLLVAVVALGLIVTAVALWYIRKYVERLRQLSQHLVEAQEGERKRLARELHDEVGQILTALRVQLGQIEAADGASREHAAQATELADRSLRSVREMARGLRPAMLDDLGLGSALRWLTKDFGKHSGLEVELEMSGELADLDDAHRTCVYRVVQESLTNCAKHARASAVKVAVEESAEEIRLTVTDDGVGMGKRGGEGIGILGMQERVAELGGKCEVDSEPGEGTVVRARWPRGKTAVAEPAGVSR